MSLARLRRRMPNANLLNELGLASGVASDITSPSAAFREVYDVGPGAGASLFVITPDDRYLILLVAGILSPGDPDYDRDYRGEHSRRIVALDIRRLLAAGSRAECDAPRVVIGPDGFTKKILGHNNSAAARLG